MWQFIKRPNNLAFIIFFAYLAIGLATLSDYSITWDEPENFSVGRRTLSYFLKGDGGALKGLPPTIALPLPFRDDGHLERYPPFAATIASLVSLVVAETFPIIHPVTAHHAAVVGITAIGVVSVFGITYILTQSVAAGVWSAIFAGFHPLVFGASHNNIKDAPSLAILSLGLLCILLASKKETVRWALVSGVVGGIALSTKLTGLYLIPMALMLLRKRMVWYLVGFVLAVGIAWPWMRMDPMAHMASIMLYVNEVGRGLPVMLFGEVYDAGNTAPWYYALTYFVLTTPLPILALSVLGTMTSPRNALLPFVWLVMSLGRTMLPHAIVYNGIRQSLDVFAPMAVLAGIGWHVVSKRVRAPVVTLLGFGIVAHLFWISIVLHPYQSLYYNALAGDFKSVPEKYEFDYWGSSLGEMVRWVNTNGSQGATIDTNWITIDPSLFPGNAARFATESATYVLLPNSKNYFEGAINYWHEKGTLVYTVRRMGADIGYVFQTSR